MKELKRVWLHTVFSREKKQLSDEIWIRQVWNNKNPLHVMKLLQDTCGVKSWYKLENLEEWAIKKSYWIIATTEFGYL